MKTRSIFERYHIRDEETLREGAGQLEATYKLPKPDEKKVVGMGKVDGGSVWESNPPSGF